MIMIKCKFCDRELPIPVDGKLPPNFECPFCGRPVEGNTDTPIETAQASPFISLIHLASGESLDIPIGRSYILGRESFGREIFKDCKFSRKHCLIETSIDDIFICDLGSLNGTYVNGKRIFHKVKLVGDERITFADEVFLIKKFQPANEKVNTEDSKPINICPNCGYQDYKGLPRCPECGFGWM